MSKEIRRIRYESRIDNLSKRDSVRNFRIINKLKRRLRKINNN